MVDRTEWIERQFTFGLPLGMYGNVVERVRGTPARLEDLTRGLSREVLTRRDGDKWSIQEQAGHLLDLEGLGKDRLDDFEARRDTLSAADMTNQLTHEADHNAKSIESILSAFRKERMAFVARLDSYDEDFVLRTALHPRLKTQIRVIDLALFIAEHDDHHLARISELRRLQDQKEIDAAWAEEAERRMREIEEGKVELIEGELVMEQLRARFKKR